MSRTFTLEEARTLLPVLGSLMRRAREAAVRAAQVEGEMQALSQRIFLSGGLHVDVAAVARRRAEREKSMQEARTTIEEIEEIGARVGELDAGRLEFPSLLEGREVLLCWMLDGDDQIRWWREDEEGSKLQEIGEGFPKERDRLN